MGLEKNMNNNKNQNHFCNNKGITILEMLVVLCVITILTGLVAYSYQYIHNANVQEAGENLSAAIKAARTMTMSKGPEKGRLTLYSEGGKLFYTIGDSNEKQQISTQTINFWISSGFQSIGNKAPEGQTGDGTATIYFNTAGMLDTGTGRSNTNYVVFYKGNRCYSVLIYSETGKIDEQLFYK